MNSCKQDYNTYLAVLLLGFREEMMTVTDKKKLMQEIIEEQLAYHPPSLPFGERAECNRRFKKKVEQLAPEEYRLVKKEIKRIKFLRAKNLFESFYR